MSAEIINFQVARSAVAEESLVVSEDDFSIRVTSDADPFFWVRIKRTDDHSIIVTDFKAGSLQQMTLNIALRKAVSTLHNHAPKQLTFKNVALLTDLNDNERADFDRDLNVLRVASESIANINKCAVKSFRLVHDNRKLNVVVDMG